MAVTKRTRYEVLRRDNHTCRYCRSQENDLTIDHVVPVSLGGSDDPSNLVACCKDCNAGKTSTIPDSAIVADVSDVALKYAKALRENIIELTANRSALRRKRVALEAHWRESADNRGLTRVPPMDADWHSTLERWLGVGLDEDFLMDAMDIAMSRPGVSLSGRFRYFCGVVYRTLDKAHLRAVEATEPTARRWCGHCASCQEGVDESVECEVLYEITDPDDEPYSCSVCSQADCMYDIGIQAGLIHEWMANADAIMHYKKCTASTSGD